MAERLPLLGGAQSTRSPIGSVQRCVNLFPEANRKDCPSPTTHYQRPGLRKLVSPPGAATARGLFSASNDRAFCCIGQSIYEIEKGTFALTEIGQLNAQVGTPVSFSDNGVTLVIGDGSPEGFQFIFASGNFSQISDPTGIFTGTVKWDYIDTFLLWAVPGSPTFGSTLSDQVSFDALYTAAKTNYPDPLVTLYVSRHEILLLGKKKSEIWYDAGNSLFPFAELPGSYIEHGCAAPYSVAGQDVATYWLSSNLQGQGVVLVQRGYDTKRISNHALEFAIRKIAQTVGIGDAIGFCWQQDGHVFYQLSFPAGGQTWVFDESIGDPQAAWHQQAWTDPKTGVLGRHRANCYAHLWGLNVVGDWETGDLYCMDPEHYTDDVAGTAGPITCIRGFPHIKVAGTSAQGVQVMESSGRVVRYEKFVLDMETGTGPLGQNGSPAEVRLRTSRDRGRSWGNDVATSLGAPGEYEVWPDWQSLGLSRDMVFEIEYSVSGPAALNGAFLDSSVLAR